MKLSPLLKSVTPFIPPSAIQVALRDGIIFVATTTVEFGYCLRTAVAARSPAPPEPIISTSTDGKPLSLPFGNSPAKTLVAPAVVASAPTLIQALCRNSLLVNFSLIDNFLS